eukprot:486171_1
MKLVNKISVRGRNGHNYNSQKSTTNSKTSSCTNNRILNSSDDDYRISNSKLYSHQQQQQDPNTIPSLRNILINHPQYISPTLLGIESINTCNIDVPIDVIDLDVKTPIDKVIRAAADNGANIDAISGIEALKYKKHVQSDRRAFRVRTGSGYIWCKEYVPLVVNNRGRNKKIKLYIIWDLPYNYLIGRGTQRDLGWKLVQTGCSTYHHKRNVLDGFADNDIEVGDTYPTKTKKK